MYSMALNVSCMCSHCSSEGKRGAETPLEVLGGGETAFHSFLFGDFGKFIKYLSCS